MKVGIDKIDDVYHKPIEDLLDIYNNMGLIGGKGQSAFYIIGKCENKLIFLDPHFNQKAVLNKGMLEKSDYDTYFPKYHYSIKVKDISPQFSLALMFKDMKEYKLLFESIKKYEKLYPNYGLIKIKEESPEYKEITEDMLIDF